jgi:hypothetical protein
MTAELLTVLSASSLPDAITAAITRCELFGDCVLVQYDSIVMRFSRSSDGSDIDVIAKTSIFREGYDTDVAVPS